MNSGYLKEFILVTVRFLIGRLHYFYLPTTNNLYY